MASVFEVSHSLDFGENETELSFPGSHMNSVQEEIKVSAKSKSKFLE